MAGLKFTLQDKIRVSDRDWTYNAPALPNPDVCRKAGLIKSLTLVCSSSAQGIYLRWAILSSNRGTRDHDPDTLIQVSVADVRPVYDSPDPDLPSDHKQTTDYLVRFLASGITINGVRYSFFGHSNSQLKSRSCYFLAGTKEEVNKKVEALGDFTKIKTVAKKAKRIGLLFSSADVVLTVPSSKCRDIDDVEREGFIFTDGCGLISRDFVRILASKKPILFRDRRYHPSVLQIRYQGYKGVVAVEPRLEKGVWLNFRKSMKKFSGTSDLSFAVVEYSKPYTYGYLNDEILLLLSALGVGATVFATKQRQYFDFLEQARNDPKYAFRLFSSLGLMSEAETLLVEGIESIAPTIRKTITQEYSKMVNKREEQKTRILIPKSRLLFGICDPYGLLKPDECFLRVTSDETGAPLTITGANVLVSRNPCLHPGDLRKLKAVQVPQLSHLKDCIVFSTNGRRPSADLMSGGDLDGDTFFVCWDPDLIPEKLAEPAEYPGVKEATRFNPITRDDLISYFAAYNNMSLGRVKKLYLGWARAKGAHSSQCQELNRLFSQCVDGNRIKIPNHLLDPPAPLPDKEPFILDFLHELALEHCRKVKKDSRSVSILRRQLSSADPTESIDQSTVEWILSSPNPLSEFELATLVLTWCRKHRVPFEEFWSYFDTSQLAAEERTWLLSELPASPKYASSIKNGLLQSNILTRQDLQAFHLDYHSLHWKCVFDTVSDPLAKLMVMVNQTFSQFAKKLLVLRMGERLSIALYFPKPIDSEEDYVVDATVRLFAFPHSHKDKAGHRRGVPTKKNYRFYYGENNMQLYESQRSNTFVFFTKSANDDQAYRDVQGKGNRARRRQETVEEGINCEWRVSVALGKFSAQLATHVGRTNREPVTDAVSLNTEPFSTSFPWRDGADLLFKELYVITNKDVRALRALDLWLESVDTLEVLPNFPDEIPLDSLPNISDLQWDQQSEFITQVIRDKQYTLIREATGPQLDEVLLKAWQFNLADLVSEAYRRLLEPVQLGEQRMLRCNLDIVESLIKFLHFNPAMAIHFTRLCPWSSLQAPYFDLLRNHAMAILKALFLCADKMGDLILKHMLAVLQDGVSLTFGDVQELWEMASLAVPEPDLLLTIMMEIRGALSGAIRDHDPHIVAIFMRNMFGLALDHCAEVSEDRESKPGSWMLIPVTESSGKVIVVTSKRRIDAPRMTRLAVGDHVRFSAKAEPAGVCVIRPTAFDAIVTAAAGNEFKFKCIRQPPDWIAQMPFEMKSCVAFVTTKTTGDALVDLIVKRDKCCGLTTTLLCPSVIRNDSSRVDASIADQPIDLIDGLNESQSRAVVVATGAPLTCLWGPPGTGKTTTIVSILRRLLEQDNSVRMLVTAPTHNAVDNVLRQFVKKAWERDKTLPEPVRVSTELSRVSDDLKAYTCDAMLGKDLHEFPAARKKAIARISKARLVFTTCVGAALGLLREQSFDTVIIDEASQQTEPASLIPLVKGCQRAILVGDHVQLRATVSPHAAAVDFDVSLMERLWTSQLDVDGNPVAKVMLDTQYRMHPELCRFPSTEFYDGRLLTAATGNSIPVPASRFPWPASVTTTKEGPASFSRAVFLQCNKPEDYGRKSKVNQAQAQLCKYVLELLTTAPTPCQASDEVGQPSHAQPQPPMSSIAILTPYTRQSEVLKQICPRATISSIDGFQGQEADVVIFVTVRCNNSGEIGFLKDLRRLNVALTRAKAGLIVIGDQRTLTARKDVEEACRVWERLVGSCSKVALDGVGGST